MPYVALAPVTREARTAARRIAGINRVDQFRRNENQQFDFVDVVFGLFEHFQGMSSSQPDAPHRA